MPKAEKGTPKAIANAMKSKGLQRLRWYCQVCEKQCRDENGFKCHTMSESHLRQMLVVGENASKYINNYSEGFKKDFIGLLSRRWGTKRVLANMVYQEFIADKNHLHMNATHWVTLTDFVKEMGREGVLQVDETEKGWFISWIDNSPQALARQAASLAKERSDMDDEQRMRKLISEQIEKANREKLERGEKVEDPEKVKSNESEEPSEEKSILKRDSQDGPLKLSFGGPLTLTKSIDPKPSTASNATSTTISTGLIKPSTSQSSSSKPNPLKRPLNPLKVAASKSLNQTRQSSVASSSKKSLNQQPQKKSALESIIAEDEARKRRRDERSWSGPNGHGASGLQIRRN